jgi:hypothetical protein
VPLVVVDPSLAAALAQVRAQPVGVVALVGAQAADPAGRFGQDGRSGGDVAGVAGRQPEGAGPAEDCGDRSRPAVLASGAKRSRRRDAG